MGRPQGRLQVVRRAPITVEELLEIHRHIKQQAANDRSIHYSDLEGRGPSIGRLEAIVKAFPALPVDASAAWILRAVILTQPFPDGNHRAGIGAAELVLQDGGKVLRIDLESGAEFQRDVSAARRERLGGYDDAPLSSLTDWDDKVMACCVAFVRAHASAQAAK